MVFYFILMFITFIIFQAIILRSPYSKVMCQLFTEIFEDTFIGDVYEVFLDEEPEEDTSKAALAILFFVVWLLFTIVSLVLSLIWPVSLVFLLIVFIFTKKSPFKQKQK